MALDATRLATALKAAFISAGAVDGSPLTSLCSGLASAIVTEITTHAVVPAGLLISPGGLSPAPVTGTTTVT